jgi:hypothetical protein
MTFALCPTNCRSSIGGLPASVGTDRSTPPSGGIPLARLQSGVPWAKDSAVRHVGFSPSSGIYVANAYGVRPHTSVMNDSSDSGDGRLSPVTHQAHRGVHGLPAGAVGAESHRAIPSASASKVIALHQELQLRGGRPKDPRVDGIAGLIAARGEVDHLQLVGQQPAAVNLVIGLGGQVPVAPTSPSSCSYVNRCAGPVSTRSAL